MTYLKIQEFVRRVRKRARKAGCKKCHKGKEVGLRGTPRLSELSRDGSGIAKLKAAIRERGWYCRTCVRRIEGTTATATLRDQYDMGDPAQEKAYFTKVWRMEGCQTDAPNGYRRVKVGIGPESFVDLKTGV